MIIRQQRTLQPCSHSITNTIILLKVLCLVFTSLLLVTGSRWEASQQCCHVVSRRRTGLLPSALFCFGQLSTDFRKHGARSGARLQHRRRATMCSPEQLDPAAAVCWPPHYRTHNPPPRHRLLRVFLAAILSPYRTISHSATRLPLS